MNLYDANEKTMDINTLRVTSLPFNPGVMMPRHLKQEEEVKMESLRMR